MSFLYRNAVTVTRLAPFDRWAEGFNDGVTTDAMALSDRRTVYLVPEATSQADVATLLDDFWADIFEAELASWMIDDHTWPTPRTRQMFDEWFSVELTEAVFDLTPDEPLTETDVETADLEYAVTHCAWCDLELDEGAGRFVAFPFAERELFEHRAGAVLDIPLDAERSVTAVLAAADSAKARDGEDVLCRACCRDCERALRSRVPKALKKLASRVRSAC